MFPEIRIPKPTLGGKAHRMYRAEFPFSFPVVIYRQSSSNPVSDVIRSLELLRTPNFLIFDTSISLLFHIYETNDPLVFGFEIGKLVAE